ncbi:hypothetical protein F5B22DRAFT_139500 [Xylaria bambusicola]|uniref:uncharacterized protein n=1 Tax=Xylaria bambusicola TaxID=326684 RepID=UPI00200879D3|nr:uncharacterized protein F5B22DRAFT_139500 [Xylaria bambusicola]KAI0516970.1 hypothetical protein F5B22DRAFT_139500 [Xylaria bambusicola]
MRPRTPALNVGHTVAGGKPTSPPETPTRTSPMQNRPLSSGAKSSSQAKAHHYKGPGPNIRPLGGNKFSYTRDPRAEEISPRSSHSSDDESESSASIPESLLSGRHGFHKRHGFQFTTAAAAIAAISGGATIRIEEAGFAVEDLSDYSLDSDEEIDLDVIRPYAIEYGGESERSRSASRAAHELDPALTAGVRHLSTFDSDSEELDPDDEFQMQLRLDRQARRIRRMKSGSISKRTISERDSDSDREDILPWVDANDPGPGPVYRRVRRKGENRTSIHFSGPLPERIEELKEPNSDDEVIIDDAELFARELPYFSFMEVDYA